MNINEFINHFSISPNKYIVFYGDINYTDYEINFFKIINEKYDILILHLLLKNEDKKNKYNYIIEIYPDDFSEEYLIKNTLFIIYNSNINRSLNLINLLKLYHKYIIYQKDNLIELSEFFINYNQYNIDLDELINKSINNFEINYHELIIDEKIKKKNIKLNYNKIIKSYHNDKIYIITYFKKFDLDILNIIQKKCVIENLKNKYVDKLIVIGKNIKEEFKDLFFENNENNLILYEFYNDNLSFKNLLEIINNNYFDKIICILRSDIILPNQKELDDLNIELLSNDKDIYCISRIERLINGNLIKYDKLNRILFCTEQDAWIFKSPINITSNLLDENYFYDKYSELIFNHVLKENNYKLINNTTKYKILRILYENNLENRLLMNDKNINIKNNLDNIYLLPDNESFDKINIEQLIRSINIDSKELYDIKCYLFNKYLKNKIIKDLIIT